MSRWFDLRGAAAACAFAATVVSSSTAAAFSFIDAVQDTSWTITRLNVTEKYRVVAYGDSLFAGYANQHGEGKVVRRASPYVSGEYLSHQWGTNIEVVRRAISGARAQKVYNQKIFGERSFMESEDTRVVMFEMCGNDYLDRRNTILNQPETDQEGDPVMCNYTELDQALADCTYYMEQAMRTINESATHAKSKIIMNLYYPGYHADDMLTACTDASTGTRANLRDKFLPYLLKSNWRACNLAAQYGFKCADAFAEMMATDYDSNGDGLIDVDAVRYRAGEGEAAYVNRILSLKSTLRGPRTHYVNSTTRYEYLLEADAHQSYYGMDTITLTGGYWGIGGSGSGSDYSDFTDAQIVDGKNTKWNKWGHERTGWLLSLFNPATP